MKRSWLFIILFLLVGSTAAVGDKAAAEAVTYPGKAGLVPARLYQPGGAGPFPGVLVLHTSGGIEPEVEEYAQALAREGFAAMAIDYFATRGGADPGQPRREWAGEVADLAAGVEYLLSQPQVKKEGLGAVGFSLGAQRAIQMSGTKPEVKAVVGYYGPYDPTHRAWVPEPRRSRLLSILPEATRTSAAVLLLHGDWDLETPVGEAQAMAKALKEAGKSVEVVIYPKAGHRFNFRRGEGRPDRGGGMRRFSAEATADAFRRTVAFLKQHLVGKEGGSP